MGYSIYVNYSTEFTINCALFMFAASVVQRLIPERQQMLNGVALRCSVRRSSQIVYDNCLSRCVCVYVCKCVCVCVVWNVQQIGFTTLLICIPKLLYVRDVFDSVIWCTAHSYFIICRLRNCRKCNS